MVILKFQYVIEELKEHAKTDVLKLHSGASEAALKELEVIYGKVSPKDFRTLYKFSNGFETDDHWLSLYTAFFKVVYLKRVTDIVNYPCRCKVYGYWP